MRRSPPLYVALEEHDPDLLGRVRERRSRIGGEGLSIRRGERLHLYSTIPLSGTKPPTFWIGVQPDVALELLAFQSLRLPGLGTRVEHGPLGWRWGWIRPRTTIFKWRSPAPPGKHDSTSA